MVVEPMRIVLRRRRREVLANVRALVFGKHAAVTCVNAGTHDMLLRDEFVEDFSGDLRILVSQCGGALIGEQLGFDGEVIDHVLAKLGPLVGNKRGTGEQQTHGIGQEGGR